MRHFNGRGHKPPANPFADPRPIDRCDKCGSTEYRRRPIHTGVSTIRECDRCRPFMGIVAWYGELLPGKPVATDWAELLRTATSAA